MFLHTAKALTLIIALFITESFAGTGGGNEYHHYVNNAFDFHIASPTSWSCQGCDSQERSLRLTEDVTNRWIFTAPKGKDSITVEFIEDGTVGLQSDLLNKLQKQGGEWYPYQRNGESFVGYTNSPLYDEAESADEYFLVAKYLIIRITWKKDENPATLLEFKKIKKSIDRASKPPRIIEIKSTQSAPYKIGDKACLRIKVEDMRNNTELKVFNIEGVPKNFSFKSITWLNEFDSYETCFLVTTSFQTNSLRITGLELEYDKDQVSCTGDNKNPDVLICKSRSRDSESYSVKPQLTPIDNPHPDREGPSIANLSFNESEQSLTWNLQDQTGVYMAEIFVEERSVVVYPDQIRSGIPVYLSPIFRPGWNSVTRIIIVDNNGFPSILRVKNDVGHTALNTYELVAADGKVSDSGIPVISYLLKGPINEGIR